MKNNLIKDLSSYTDDDIINLADSNLRNQFGNFIKEFNKREWSVRIKKNYSSFDDYANNGGYIHKQEFGYGFVVDKKPVPYFHPNRSFHDEIIWLNSNLYYKNDVTFEDKLVNSAIVKFYGPSRTLDIITGNEPSLHYLEKTDFNYIKFSSLKNDKDYEYKLLSNIEKAFANGEKIWGTTELRTSLQTASRNFSRLNPSLIDKNGLPGFIIEDLKNISNRKMRPSDMINWIASFSEQWCNFYRKKPTMKDSFEFLTLNRGIGNYYGYHFSTNLARMPGVGSDTIINTEYKDKFKSLQSIDSTLTHGNLDENSDYVVAGPGAMETLKTLFPTVSLTDKNIVKCILAIRNNQHKFFNLISNDEIKHLTESSELGTFTTFGIEISCCQFNVFNRAKNSPEIASKRAQAPISQIAKTPNNINSLLNF